MINFHRIIYHGGCPDGIAAAWPFWRENKNKNAIYEGYKHGQTPPVIEKGETIAILDFCFPYEVILEMAAIATRIVILDHHVSAERHIFSKDLPMNVEIVYDTKRSGAQIAWDWVYPYIYRYPWFINIIAQRDLWKWTDPNAKAIGEGLFLNGYYKWYKLEELWNMSDAETEKIKGEMYVQGCWHMKEKDRVIAVVCSNSVLSKLTTPSGKTYTVMLATCQYKDRSDVGNELCKKYPDVDFAVTYTYDFLLDEWWISCRASSESSQDLTKICSEFSRSGGHAKAAGFTIFGSKNEKLQTYFKALEVPKNRMSDSDLVDL